MFISSIFDTIFINPFINALVAFYQVFAFLGIPYALGFSIIALTLAIRFILYPLTKSQLMASKKMQELNPHLASLKELHKGDAKRLQEETMKLYKEHGFNPASGCLLLLVQIPIIWGLYSVLTKIVGLSADKIVSEVNKVLYLDSLHLVRPWSSDFFGISLSQSPSSLIQTMGVLVLLVPLLTGFLQFIQSKMMIPLPSSTAKPKKNDDFATVFQTQSTYLFPVMIAVLSFNLPLGMSLYWNTFGIFGIIQQYLVSGWGSLKTPKFSKVKNGRKK